MFVVKVTSKGQIIIPAKLRKNFDIGINTKLLLVEHKGNIVMKKIDSVEIESILKSKEDK